MRERLFRQRRGTSVLFLAAIALAALLHPVRLWAASTITYVQGNYATPQTPQTSVTIPFTAAQSTGDLNVVVVGWNDTTATVSTVTDKSGNVYTRAVGPTVVTGSLSQSIYHAKNIAAATAGANAVTVTFSTAATYPDIRILEYRGADTNNPVDVVGVGSGVSKTSSSSAVTTTNATDLIFGANTVSTLTTRAGSGFTKRLLTSPDGDIAEDQMVTTTGAYSATAPLSSSGPWVMQMVAFRTPGAVVGSFALSASPATLSVTQGNQGTSTITTTVSGGFSNSITLSASGAPTGATVGFNPSTIAAPGAGNSTITIIVGSSTPTGTYAITVTGTGGGVQQSTSITLTVAAGPTFTLAASPTSLSVTPGNKGTSTITTSGSGGFSNSIALSASGAPAGTTVSFNPSTIAAPGAGTSTMTITVASSTPAGSYPITVTGNGGGVTQTATVTLTVAVPNFTLSASPASLSITPGNQGTSTITTTVGGGFSNSITLSASGAPTGTIVGFNPSTIAAPGAGNSTMNITVGSSTPTGTYPITVTGNGGGVQQNATVTLTVVGASTAISYIQGNYATPQTSEISVTIPFTAAQSTGDLNVVVVGWNDTTTAVSSVTDKSGNNYTLAVGPTAVGGFVSQSIYYAKNIAGAAAAANAVTVAFSAAAAFPDIRILEYSGADFSNPVDVAAGGSGTSSTSSSAAASTTNSTDLIFGANMVYTLTTAPGSGFTTRLLTSPDGDIAEDKMVTATGSYSASATLNSSGPWVMQMVAFRTSSGTTTGLSISPRTAVVTFTETQQFSATSGSGTVTWSVDGSVGGSPSSGTITAGGLYTPPTAVGTHVVTASTGSSQAVNATIYITNYAGTFTYHNDNLRTGQNLSETVLTPTNVNSTQFGKLFSYSLDGIAFASPLYVANVNIPNRGFYNVVYVATENDSVYAFDADGRSGTTPIWQVSFLRSGVTTVPCADVGECGDIPNQIGITSTPVIDQSTGTLYVVAKTKEGRQYVQRLHALDITTGAEKFGGPVIIQGSVPGSGEGGSGGFVPFDPLRENQRPGLLLNNGVIYLAFGSHGDSHPWHGWVLGYNATTLKQVLAYNVTPNAFGGGIWQGGGALAADANGNIYFATSNGTFDVDTGGVDYGDTVEKLASNGSVADYFTPHDQANMDAGNLDLGAGGPVMLVDQTTGPNPHLLITAGKTGTIYVINRDNMGHFNPNGDSQIVQSLTGVLTSGGDEDGNFSTPVYFNGYVYFAAVNDFLKAFQLNSGQLSTAPTSESAVRYPCRGGSFAISANGNNNGIIWTIQNLGDPNNDATTPGVLIVYSATDLTHELYDTTQAGSRDTMDFPAKFSIPLVANGKIFIAGQTQLIAYGLLP
jgi:uncharacterized membrane protein